MPVEEFEIMRRRMLAEISAHAAQLREIAHAEGPIAARD